MPLVFVAYNTKSKFKEDKMSTNKRSGFSMIELVFVIVILGVLAAVAVPRFVATRQDAQVATARSDLASAQKAIVAKIFADNIDSTQSQAPDPNRKAAGANYNMNWGDWIIEIAGLDGGRWNVPGGGTGSGLAGAYNALGELIPANKTIQPVGNVMRNNQAARGGCGSVLGIHKGYMIFAPNALATGTGNGNNQFNKGDFCTQLAESYKSSGGPGNKLVPLASSGTVEF